MKSIKIIALISCVIIATGCASGLNSIQKREYTAMKNDGVLVKEKNPSTGVALGFLPGGGSFYTRHPGLGVVNLLLWPLSILWDPVSGHEGSMAINYDLTKYNLKREKGKEIAALDKKLGLGEIDSKIYVLEKSEIEKKYTY